MQTREVINICYSLGFFGRDECVTDKNLIADTVQNGGKRVTVYR